LGVGAHHPIGEAALLVLDLLGEAKQSATPADEVRPSVWLGNDYQLQCQPAGGAGITKGSWQRGHWRALSPLVGPVAAPMEWVEPVLLT
jgi:hypothetical protein